MPGRNRSVANITFQKEDSVNANETANEARQEEDERAVQVYSAYLPDPVKRERMKETLAYLPRYRWMFAAERDGAIEEFEGAKAAHELGLKKQVRLHLERAEDKFFFDATNKAVAVARRAGFGLRPLAKLSKEPAKKFEIRGARLHGQDVRWRFSGIEEYESAVPARILRDAKKLRASGFEWEDCFVGEPFVVATQRFDPDPILAIAIGRWLLEVGRW